MNHIPDEPVPQFNDITYQQVDVDLLISEPPPPPLEFWPLNYLWRKTTATRIFCLMWDKNSIELPYDGVGIMLVNKARCQASSNDW